MVPASGKKPEFDPVIKALLDPIIQICERTAESYKSKGSLNSSRKSKTSIDVGQSNKESSPIDAFLSKTGSSFAQSLESPSKIFLINCLCAIQQPLVGHNSAAKYVNDIGSMIEKQINMLVEEEVEVILRRCGLLDKMVYFKKSPEIGSTGDVIPLAAIAEVSPQVILECLRTFFGIVTGTEGSLQEFELMQVPRLRSDTCIRVAKALVESYTIVYDAVSDPKNNYPDLKLLLRHAPDQIRTILAI